MPVMRGSGAEVGELLAVKCTYKDCLKHFHTQKEMKRHKLDDLDHNYCKRCDVDCEDYEALVQHKVDEMSPWLEGRKTGLARDASAGDDDEGKAEQPKHIVCEFCGADFRSFGGRKAHRSQEHAADQSIRCPGCKAYFHRAANLVQHLEDDQCSFITRRAFLGTIRQKHFLKAVFAAPDHYLAALQMEERVLQQPEEGLHVRTLTIDDTSTEDDSGGVTIILDQDDPAQKDGYQPMEPDRPGSNLIDLDGGDARESSHSSAPYNRAQHEKWPRLPGTFPNSSVDQPTMKSSTASSVCYDSDGDDSVITSRRGGIKVETISNASIRSGFVSPMMSPTTSNPWDNGNLAQKLSRQNIQKIPRAKAGDWSNFTKDREEAASDANRGNVLYSHWWDPKSEDYNVERFMAYVEVPKLDSKTGMMLINPRTGKPVIEAYIPKYCCPDPECKAKFDNADEFETHWVYGHNQMQWRCPCCLKLFKNVASLIRHCESNSKCGVKYSDQFQQLISDMTGGFLKTKRLEEPRIFRQEKALVVAGKPIYGLMPVEYST